MNALSPDKTQIVREFPIVNQRGLHARASAKFVQLASGFHADVHVEKDGIKVGGTSIMGLMMLAASPGCSIRVTASGAGGRGGDGRAGAADRVALRRRDADRIPLAEHMHA